MSHSVTEVLEAFAHGEIVVVTDDDDRENEGDLFVAASLCTPEKMAFIVRHTSGIVCAPLPAAEARRLRLAPLGGAHEGPPRPRLPGSGGKKHRPAHRPPAPRAP